MSHDHDPEITDDVIAGREPGHRRAARSGRRRLAVAVGGALGALARWGIGLAWPAPHGGFPASTLLINVVGCLLMGVLVVHVVEVREAHPLVRPFLGVGVLGGFTTFSTFAVDTEQLLVGGHLGVAARLPRGDGARFGRGRARSGSPWPARTRRGEPAGDRALGRARRRGGRAAALPHRPRVQSAHGTSFPWGTVTVNVVASLVLGVVIGSAAGSAVAAVVGTGFCGGLSTWSTLGYETVRLAEAGERTHAVLDVVIQTFAGSGRRGSGWCSARRCEPGIQRWRIADI